MSIVSLLPYIQIALGVLLIGLILLQRSEAGLGSAFGESGFGGNVHTRRGAEKTFFNLTVVIAILFVASTVVALVL
ncbi:MAG: hypothetical protein RJA61_715 [Candidatus Parcubacteria bacterium]|jgi:preprotein translocase subunit SecG